MRNIAFWNPFLIANTFLEQANAMAVVYSVVLWKAYELYQSLFCDV